MRRQSSLVPNNSISNRSVSDLHQSSSSSTRSSRFFFQKGNNNKNNDNNEEEEEEEHEPFLRASIRFKDDPHGFVRIILIVGIPMSLVLSIFLVTLWMNPSAIHTYKIPVKIGMASQATSNDRYRSIAILGERNSGTRWIFEHLGLCFNHTIPVYRHLTRYKHWFQTPESLVDWYRYNETPVTSHNDTIVIAMFRDVYDWTEAMRVKPHHAANHIDLQWKDFVTKPWTMDRIGLDLDLEIHTNNQSLKEGRICQQYFYYHEIISCNQRPYPKDYWNNNKQRKSRFAEHQPFYEMKDDGSGEPYDNILQMRADKIRNFMGTLSYNGVTGVWAIRYEDMVENGTTSLIEKLSSWFQVTPTCEAYLPQTSRPKRTLPDDFRQWLLDHVDWNAEQLIGYDKSS